MSDRAPVSAGLLLNRSAGTCGICGHYRKLTKTHVPPQAAGNTGQVRRADVMSSRADGFASGPWRIGGMWVRGLCRECNSFAGSRYDAAYADFAHQLWVLMSGRPRLQRAIAPAVRLAPGRVTRAVLSGMMGLSPHIRVMHPTLAGEMVRGGPVRLPAGLRLYAALYAGNRALITGPILTGATDGTGRAINTMATVTFRPLAWALATSDSDELLTDRGFVDATEWLRYEDDRDRHDLRWLAPHGLSLTQTILHAPSDDGFQLYSKDIAPIMAGLIPS